MSAIHLIAIGGAVMHNLALALKSLGHQVSGSDDQIFEPARSRLHAEGILPDKDGWFPEKINSDIELIILGMHAKKDNPELAKGMELGLKIVSFPEYIGEVFRNKFQIVVCGSHGKTTTTSMIMHIMKQLGMPHDYLVGAQLKGYDHMVQISHAPHAVIEGDEYLSSCIDMQSKFHHYNPGICIITGLAWDHYNVFPQYEDYLNTFRKRILSMRRGTTLVYFEGDEELVKLCEENGSHLHLRPYSEAPHSLRFGQVYLETLHGSEPIDIFGNHNLQNLGAAKIALEELGVHYHQIAMAIKSFTGASKRLELIGNKDSKKVYLDFAHAPSKVRACVQAICQRYQGKVISALIELHTYSSLNIDFLPQYLGVATGLDRVAVYFDKKALEIKKLKALDSDIIRNCFGRNDILVVEEAAEVEAWLKENHQHSDVLVLIGSGNFGGIPIRELFV